ncbi:MAG: hypothetical protein Q9157_002728 [Trypethelium eluteriae]
MSTSARTPSILHSVPLSGTFGAQSRSAEINEAIVRPPAPETFEERRARTEAAMIMASNERLEWHARARNETVPQTRLYFSKIVAGIDDSQWPVMWKEDYEDSDNDDPKGKKPESSRHGARTEQGGISGNSRPGRKEGGKSSGQTSANPKAKHRA